MIYHTPKPLEKGDKTNFLDWGRAGSLAGGWATYGIYSNNENCLIWN